MKILFIDPPFKRFTGLNNPFFPLGLTYLSAVCNKNGYKAFVYEVDAVEKSKTLNIDTSDEHQKLDIYQKAVNEHDNPVWDEILNLALDYDPEVIGISVMTTKIASSIRTAETLKMELKDVSVVFGGPHATILPEQCFKIDHVDYVLRGECEGIILKFLSFIEGKLDINEVNNLSYKNTDGNIIHNLTEKPIENLDTIPFPDRDSLLFKNNYTSEDMGMIMATRGCPFKCTYCAHTFGRKVRKRSVENVLEEIKLLKRRYGTTQFSFKDDTFTFDNKWVKLFCNKIIEEGLNINWDCTTRANLVNRDLIKLMKKAGCNDIRLGIETGDPKILEETKKGISLEQMKNAANTLNDNGVLWTGYFMYGLPTETKESIISTYEFMEELNPNHAGLGLYNPFPQTELFDLGIKLGLIDGDVEIDHFFNTNPKDYFFKDPRKRVLKIEPEEFMLIEKKIQEKFGNHNKKLSNLLIRALSRKNNYLKHPDILLKDLSRFLNIVNLNKFDSLK